MICKSAFSILIGMICFSPMLSQTNIQTVYFYNEDSVALSLPDFRLKNDSVKNYILRADSALVAMHKVYSKAKHFQDSIHLAHGGCPTIRCHHITDSVESEQQYRTLFQKEARLIDSILNENIRDTINVYAAQFARSKKYRRLMEEKQMITLPHEGAEHETMDVTRELIAYMNQKRKTQPR